jgi:hypothetical protein
MPVRDTDYQNLRDNIHPQLAELSDEQLETALARAGMNAEAMEGFFSDLGKFASSAGKAVLQAAPSILPVAGTIVGTAFGGPIGASLGGALGSLAGKAVGAATGQPAPAGDGGGLGGLLGGAGGLGNLLGGSGGIGGLVSAGLGALAGGSPAAGQLLQTITKPETMQALTSMAMGAMGKPNVSVGGTSVPVGAFGNLLSMLAGRMETEYAESLARAEGDGTPAYMKDFSGQPVSDPAVPRNRAVALYELLQSAERDGERNASEADAGADAAELDMEAMQAEYDEMELAEVYDSEEA